MRQLLKSVAAVVALSVAVVVFAVPAGGAGCATAWGSLPRSDAAMTQAPITNVRAARHPCFDRITFDLRGAAGGFSVEYVPQVTEDGSGEPVPLRGGAFLQVVVRAPAHDSNGNPTYTPANPSEAVNVAGFSTFRQVAFAGSFEGVTTLGLGVRARLPFRVFVLRGPGTGSRVVVDVAHRWS